MFHSRSGLKNKLANAKSNVELRKRPVRNEDLKNSYNVYHKLIYNKSQLPPLNQDNQSKGVKFSDIWHIK